MTGKTLPPIYIGRFVPGTGNITNGMVIYDGTPQKTHPFRAGAAHRLRVGRDR